MEISKTIKNTIKIYNELAKKGTIQISEKELKEEIIYIVGGSYITQQTYFKLLQGKNFLIPLQNTKFKIYRINYTNIINWIDQINELYETEEFIQEKKIFQKINELL